MMRECPQNSILSLLNIGEIIMLMMSQAPRSSLDGNNPHHHKKKKKQTGLKI
jgi:hypothetical protein